MGKHQAGQEEKPIKVNAVPSKYAAAKSVFVDLGSWSLADCGSYIESAKVCCTQPEADVGVMQQAGGT